MLLDVLKSTPASIPRPRLDLLLNAPWYEKTAEGGGLKDFFKMIY